MIRIYSNNCKDFTNNGLGILLDFKSSPKITESLNGNFELNFDYAIKGKNVEYLVVDNIIKAPFDGSEQLFRIKKVKPNLSKVSIYATHIFYDLSENFLLDVAPTQKSAVNAINWLLDHAMYKTDFVVTGDISQEETARYVRKNIVDAILGTDNCIVKKWGGEIERDNFQIIYHRRRGTDNGILIKQGKNIKEIELAIDFTNVVTRVIPQGTNELLLPEIYVDSPIISTYRNPIVAKYDFNNIKVDENTTEEEAYELLRESAKKLFSDSGIDKPTISVKVNWLELSKTEEYKNYSNLESVRLGDTVTVQALGYEYKIRVIKVVYDCLLNSYIEFEIGDPKADFVNKTINNLTSEMQKNYDSLLQQAKQLATTLINNGFGGHVRIYPDRILIMDTDDESTAKNVWQWNLNGFGHSSTGINGEYGTAITIDGQIVANFITTGTMSVQRIEGLANSLNNINVALELNEKNIQQLITQTAEDLTPTAADTGSFIHLEDSTDSPVIQMKIEGKSTQETRSGKNLFNAKVQEGTYYNTTYTVEENGRITQSGSDSSGWNKSDKRKFSLSAGTYTISIIGIDSSYIFQMRNLDDDTDIINARVSQATFTLEKDTSLALKTFGGTYPKSYYIQIEKGKETTDYEPYGAMPSPEFPSEIKNVKGIKNLCEKMILVNTETQYRDAIRAEVELKSNTEYTIIFESDVSGNSLYSNETLFTSQARFNTKIGINTLHLVTKENVDKNNIDHYSNGWRLLKNNSNNKLANYTNLMIIEGYVENASYVPYGSWLPVNIVGKNLLKINDFVINNRNGINIVAKDGKIHIYGTSTISQNIPITNAINKDEINSSLLGKNIVFSSTSNLPYDTSNTSNGLSLLFTRPGDSFYIPIYPGSKSTNKVLTEPFSNFNFYITSGFEIDFEFSLQIEEGTEATEYEPYKSKTTLLQLDEPLRSLPNGIKDVAYVRNGILYVDRKVGQLKLTNTDNVTYSVSSHYFQIRNSSIKNKNGYYDNNKMARCTHFKYADNPSKLSSTENAFSNWDNENRFFVHKVFDTSEEALQFIIDEYEKGSPIKFTYELAEPYTETIGQVDMPQTYKNISNITTTDELKPNMTVEYVRDTALSNYVEGQLQNERVTREEKMAEFNVAVDAISSRVSETETELNNNYTTTDELEQKLENQKSSVMKETSTLLEQTKSDFKFEILNQINQDGVERLKNTLVTINQEGINVAKSDDDVVSLLNNVGLYVSDGKLRDDNSNLLMKTDRNGAYLKTSETKGTIKENEVIQKEKINHEKYGICQAWYWIGG